MHGVSGDGMARNWSEMKPGSRTGKGTAFMAIPHERLMERVGEKIADGRVMSLIEGMLKAGVMDSLKGWQPTEQGSPQGAVISPVLSNIYLNGLNWKMARNGFERVRDAGGYIVLCPSQEREQKALA